MSNSKLVNYTKISPYSNPRGSNKIMKITVHHMAGNLSVETCGEVFQTREASSNYGIGTDGRVGMYVEEKNRSWASSSADNDYQAVTIEVANDEIGGSWHVSDKALKKLIELCTDICKRNNIKNLNYTGDKSGNLTRHNMFAATTCPGPYLQSKFDYIANEVNNKLNGDDDVINGYAIKALLRAAMDLKIIDRVTLANDAVMGTGTEKCLKQVQKLLGLSQTGEADEKTIKGLSDLVYDKMNSMQGVTALQQTIADL